MLEVRLAAQPGEDLDGGQGALRGGGRRAASSGAASTRTGSRSTRAEPIFDVLGPRTRRARRAAGLLAFTGTTDARAFVVHDETPADVLRPIGGNLHAPDEWVDLESVRDTTLVLAMAAAEWCA